MAPGSNSPAESKNSEPQTKVLKTDRDLVKYRQARDAGEPRFSRAGLRTVARRATAEINQALNAPGKVHWWHKTVGTMYNLAERAPAFKPVFESAQSFIEDVLILPARRWRIWFQKSPKSAIILNSSGSRMRTEMSSRTSNSTTSQRRFEPIDLSKLTEASPEYYTKLQLAAERLREERSSIPWHAKRAARAKAETGDEMTYWLDLASSCINYA